MGMVEKQRIIKALKNYHDCLYTPGEYTHSICGIAALLLETETVEVRCKDCANYHEFISGYRCVHFNGGDGRAYQTSPDDFCSYGERKNNGETD